MSLVIQISDPADWKQLLYQRLIEELGERTSGMRQARLRREYEDWYPRISSGVWHHAKWVVEMVLQQQRRGSPCWAIVGRPLSDSHFEFQGVGPPQGKSWFARRNLEPRQNALEAILGSLTSPGRRPSLHEH